MDDLEEQVQTAAREWSSLAREVGVPEKTIDQIKQAHRFFKLKVS